MFALFTGVSSFPAPAVVAVVSVYATRAEAMLAHASPEVRAAHGLLSHPCEVGDASAPPAVGEHVRLAYRGGRLALWPQRNPT